MDSFLNKLKKQLYFLEESEQEKVINKYRKKIETKYKSGMSLKSSIKEIGSIDKIVKDVCTEYNLNYDYCVRRNAFDKDVSTIALVISNFIREVIKIVKKSCSGWSLQALLELCIKLIVVVLLFVFLKLPFIMLQSISEFINGLFLYPFNSTFDTFTNFVLSLGYLISCILVFLKIIGNYKRVEKHQIDESELSKIDTEYNWLDFIVRIVIYLVILIPLGLLGIITLLLIIAITYLVFTGINIIGIPIILIGLLGIMCCLFSIILDSLNHKKNTYLLPLILSVLVFIVGIVTTIINFNNFKYPNTLDKSSLVSKVESKTIELDDVNTKLVVSSGTYTIITDQNLSDNEIIVEATYYDSYVDVVYSQIEDEDYNILTFRARSDEDIDNISNLKYTLEDLRNGYIFNYSNVDNIKLTIYANDKVKNNLEQE